MKAAWQSLECGRRTLLPVGVQEYSTAGTEAREIGPGWKKLDLWRQERWRKSGAISCSDFSSPVPW
jgi:hypothetical protein